MSIRNNVKKLLPPMAIDLIVRIKKNAQRFKDVKSDKAGKAVFCNNRDSYVYRIENKHVFFGYYDLKQMDDTCTKLLAHVVDRNADPRINKASIVWFGKNDSEPHYITETKTWCWQQGSRLRWHPTDSNCIIYNDCQNEQYVCNCWNLETGESKTISRALYDISPNGKFGLSLNFSRLQRLRPGYGYAVLKDSTSNIIAPEQDGVILIDLTSGKEKLLYSLSFLAKDIKEENSQHYINHISINPSGNSFIFFHLWTKKAGMPWNMRMYISDIQGDNLKLLVSEKIISHYCWVNDYVMIVTTSEGLYYTIDIPNGKMELIESYHLIKDGHPNWIGNGFLSDTYPQKNGMQYVFRINSDGRGYRRIVSLYSDPRLYGERRCDLHPRVNRDGIVTVDTTAYEGLRKIAQFKLDESENEYVQS